MATNANQRLSIQEYLILERQSETKSDYLDGEMFAMTGASRKHNLIAGNLFAAVHAQLAGSPCEVYTHDMRVRTPSDLLTYPDIAAVCGEPRFSDEEFDTLLNPVLVAEVLSKSTESYDRLTKRNHYWMIPELSEIVFVAQHQVRIEHWRRQADGQWLVEEIDDLSRVLELGSVSCSLPLATVYRRVFGR